MILCADDFGISPGVSEGITKLIEQGRISATSCMMTEPGIVQDISNLKPHIEKVDIGLHLVLTDVKPLSKPEPGSGLVNHEGNFLAFGRLVRKSYLNRLNYSAVLSECSHQIERFIDLIGRPPDFIDGHQHVQQLPVVREAFLNAIGKYDKSPAFYCRKAGLPSHWIWRELFYGSSWLALQNLLIVFPSLRTSQEYHRRGISHNRYLLGYYDGNEETPFEDIFLSYMSLKPSMADIFFCHPGIADKILSRRDSLVGVRTRVLEFLGSDKMMEILSERNIEINRFKS